MYKCGFFGKTQVTDMEMENAAKGISDKFESPEDFFNEHHSIHKECSSFHTDCGVPVLSSIPLINLAFPRKCATNLDVTKKASEIIMHNNTNTTENSDSNNDAVTENVTEDTESNYNIDNDTTINDPNNGVIINDTVTSDSNNDVTTNDSNDGVVINDTITSDSNNDVTTDDSNSDVVTIVEDVTNEVITRRLPNSCRGKRNVKNYGYFATRSNSDGTTRSDFTNQFSPQCTENLSEDECCFVQIHQIDGRLPEIQIVKQYAIHTIVLPVK